MYSQVQLYYNSDDYFVADQLFVKYTTNAAGKKVVDDIVVIEDKLSSTTRLTTPQNNALKSSSYRVRSQSLPSKFNSGQNLTQGTDIKFSNSNQWYKVNDGSNGKTILGINKIQ